MRHMFKYVGDTIAGFSILSKLLLSFFVIVIPLYAFNFYVNDVGAIKNRKEISAALMNSIHSYNKILETELRRIKQVQDQSAVEIALMHVNLGQAPISTISKTRLILEIRKLMVNLQTSSRLVENVRAYLPILNDTVPSYGSSSGMIDPEEFQSLQHKKPGDFLNYWKGSLYVSSPYIQTAPSESGGLFILAAQLYDVSIISIMDNIMGYESGGATLYGLNEPWHISTSPSASVDLQLQQFLEQQKPMAGEAQIRYTQIKGERYLVAYERSAVLNTVLTAYAKEDEVFGSLRTYRIFFWIMSVLSFLIIILFSLWLYKIIHKPLKTLVNAFRKVERGSLQFTLQHASKDEFGYMYEKFNDMVSRLDFLIHQVYEQQLRNQRSELKRLQSQINPHFLYNSFFVLSRLIHSTDPDKASRFSEYLGQYFQFITRDAPDEIRLEQEVQHARTYVDIQTVCYDKRIAVAFEELPLAYQDIMVPRLILQPLIENSYKYAFEEMLQNGKLIIRFSEEAFGDSAPYPVIIIEDNGDHMTDQQLKNLQASLVSFNTEIDESTGMYNIHKRIQLNFGSLSGIQLARSTLGGLKVTLLLTKE